MSGPQIGYESFFKKDLYYFTHIDPNSQ